MPQSPLPSAPAQQRLDMLNSVFGPSHFEHGRLVLTVARDVTGMMKLAHQLQARVNESFGAVVEVIMEHVKYEWWLKLHETTTTVGLHKGQEVPDCQVTNIPEGIRQHPYKRSHLPTLEVLLLWEDASKITRGHCLYTIAHPDVPSLDQVPAIFEQIEPFFAKRWLIVELSLGPPIRGDLEEIDEDLEEELPHDTYVGGGYEVTVLALHPYGFAREQKTGASANAPHVATCQPIVFKGTTDDAGRAKICFLPADLNKIQIAETGKFMSQEVTLPRKDMTTPHFGPTTVKISVTPKALATLRVFVFAMPKQLPAAEDTDGIIDWATEEREALPSATVELKQLQGSALDMLLDGEKTSALMHSGDGLFLVECGGIPEGCVSLAISCPGHESEERVVMLLVGSNDIFIPLKSVV